ncbi:transcription factor EAT1-like [Canna indica]|uniref:Transcription factor EAT1-like n=1 Tax=Canna indica TaxID=4628 RepID=A0AAQ3QRX2_9LILI|nr:transcription factor EAT1-like [Canna indica]
MYHFGSYDPAATTVYQDLPLMADSNGSSGLLLEQKLRLPSFINDASMQLDHLHHQLGLDAKQDIPAHHLLHPPPAGAYCFEPTSFADLSQADGASTVFFDPLNQQPPLMVKEALGSFPNVSGLIASGYAAGLAEDVGLHGEQLLESPVHVNGKRNPWGIKQGGQKNEKQRRERLGKKFEDLKSLIPNSTKPYRASIVADTIEYINELLRTVEELKILVEKKRHKRERAKSIMSAGGDHHHQAGDMESSSSLMPLPDGGGCGDRVFDGMLRSSWIQRRSKETFVDVRIVDDEVNIKLIRRKRVNCLVVVARVLDELGLELLHLSGGNVGGSHIFMINTKIHEGSSVYAIAIAKKLVEAMDVN